MNIEELQDFTDWEIKRVDSHFGKSSEMMKLWTAVKLSEEIGELQAEILGQANLQRKKETTFTKESLEKEFADVIISACILARRHNIDIIDALTKKIDIIRRRKY